MKKIWYKRKGSDVGFFIDEDEIFLATEVNGIPLFTDETEIIEKIKKNEDNFFDFSKNIIDIGAFNGCYSMLLNFKYNYCFEPNKITSAMLWANAYVREKAKYTDVYNVALSDKKGTLTFNGFECEDTTKNTNGEFGYKIEQVECRTLDSYNLDNIGFIKIDVEGFEEKVIRGGLLTIIGNNYPPILFECWDVDYYGMTQEKRNSLFNLLKTLGYEILEYWGDFETHLAIHK